MTQRISESQKEYYWRDLRPEYEEMWGKTKYAYIKGVHDGIGNRTAQTQRFVRMLLLKNFQYGDTLRLSSVSLRALTGRPSHFRLVPLLSSCVVDSKKAFTWSSYKTEADRTIYRFENTFIGNVYAAFLAGSIYHLDGHVQRSLRTSSLDPVFHLDPERRADQPFILSQENFSFNFEKLPDGSRYVSSLGV